MVTNFKGRTYEEKLAKAGMVTLETRRLRGDLLQTYTHTGLAIYRTRSNVKVYRHVKSIGNYP